MGGFTPIPKLQVEDLGTEGTGDRIALFDSDGKIVGYNYVSKIIVRDTETITNATTETDAFLKTIDANTIGENDVINGTFIFNCLAATTKVDYKVVFAGIDVAVFSQVGYQAVNESTEISIKVFRDAKKLKVSSSLIGGTTVVYSFYYETTPFDFLESNELKVTMEATNENEVSVQFSELIK